MTRPRRASLLAAVLLAALGFGLVVQVRQTQVGGLATLSQSELVRILGTLDDTTAQVAAETRELERDRAELRSGSDRAEAAERATRRRIEVLAILAGTAPAEGPGVRLTLADGDGAVNATAVLNAVQELRDAGAEAMQIGSGGTTVRIIASTAFTDAGSADGGIEVSGALLRSPYTLTAIGDPQTMESALTIPGGVLDSLAQRGTSGTVRSAETLLIDAVRAEPAPTFATPGAG